MHAPRSIFFLAAIFVVAGVMHFLAPAGYAAIMPPWIPYRMEMVYLSGILEIAGGVGLLITSLRKYAAIGLILLLIAVFPANVQMLINAISNGEPPLRMAMLWLRLPLQPMLIVWIFRTAIARPSRRVA